MPYKLHARPAIKDDKGVEGEDICISSYGAITDSLTRYVLIQLWTRPRKGCQDSSVGSIPARYAALKSGAADITLLDEPFSTKAEKEGLQGDHRPSKRDQGVAVRSFLRDEGVS